MDAQMELTKIDINSVSKITDADVAHVELTELQLVLVGGGVGDPIFC
jgi:hypothetical protein